MTVNIGAPQFVMLLWVLFILLCGAALHGRPRTGKHNLVGAIIVVAIEQAILFWGGFWS